MNSVTRFRTSLEDHGVSGTLKKLLQKASVRTFSFWEHLGLHENEGLSRVDRAVLHATVLVPGEYWPDWVVGKRYYWSEQYLLWAFLLFNDTFTILRASHYMPLNHEAAIESVFPFYRRTDRISSFWIQRSEHT